MEVRRGYKQTAVGVIPEDWEVKKIGNFTEACSGGTPSTLIKEYWNGEIRWMNSGELNLKKVHEVANRITELGLTYSATKLIPQNCVLIGLAGQGKTRGTVAINKIELCTNQSIAAIFPCETVDYNFLYFNLDSRYFELRGLSTGDGGRGGLNLTIIKNLLVPLPPTKSEQTAIATALSDADALITSLEKLIEKKRAIKQGAMQELLKPKEGWEVKKLGEIFSITAGGDLDTDNFSAFYDDKYCYPIYSNSLSDKGLYGYSSMFTSEKDSITVTARGTVGYANSRDHRYTAIGRVLILNPIQKLNCFFISELINNRLVFANESTGVPQLTAPQISKYEISISSFEEQIRIATILSDMDAEITALEQKLGKYKLIKQGMMQELLAGRIRLVDNV